MVALLLAELRDKVRALNRVSLPDKCEGLLRVVQLLKVDPHHGFHIVGHFICRRGLRVVALHFLRARVLRVELRRPHVLHESLRLAEGLGLHVQGHRFLIHLHLFVQLRGLLEIVLLFQKYGALATQLGVVAVQG